MKLRPTKATLKSVGVKPIIKAPVAKEPEEVPEGFEIVSIAPTTMESLIEHSYEIAGDSHDYLIRKATDEDVQFFTSGLNFTSHDTEYRYGISRYAFGQLCSKLGVPVNYMDKCIKMGKTQLAEDNVNSWLKTFKKDLFLREYDGNIRGVLSSKYSVCDSHEILEVVSNCVDVSQYKVKGSFLNEERLHLRLVSKEMLPINGEDLFAGLFIDSSDVGRSVLTVQFGIYKQVCTNGLIVSQAGGTLFQQKHIGISSEEFQTGLAASLGNIDELTAHAVDWVELARSKDCWGFNANKMSEEDMKEFLTRIRNITMLSDEGAKKVVDLMQTKYDTHRWGLINSITEVAQDYTLERRLLLERAAGRLLVA